jgi:hypothetical protein
VNERGQGRGNDELVIDIVLGSGQGYSPEAVNLSMVFCA